ncbi:gamma-glutamyltranspeptidase, partial [Cooperia oncophora]
TAYNVSLGEGQIHRNPIHAAFLRRLAIARDPVELFYRGDIANQIVHEMKQRGGLLTKTDLASFESKIEKPLEVKLSNGFSLKGPHPPSAFTALGLLVELMMSRYSTRSNVSVDVSYIRDLLKAEHAALARLEQIGDLDYMLSDPTTRTLRTAQNSTGDTSDEGRSIDIRNLMWNLKDQSSVGSHINVVDGRNLTVALSSSLNERFGSVRRSVKGGFVWNNEISSFTIPDKEKSEDIHVNAVEGRKRPRSSMAPLMVFDQSGQVILRISGKIHCCR